MKSHQFFLKSYDLNVIKEDTKPLQTFTGMKRLPEYFMHHSPSPLTKKKKKIHCS